MSDEENKGLSIDWDDATFVMPKNVMKLKAGSGGLPEVLLQRAQETMEDNHKFDFTPFVNGYLDSIDGALKNETGNLSERLSIISDNIMHLKANGGMFGFMLITQISDVALNFADSQKTINEDFVEIIEAHNNSIKLIIMNKLRGDGGKPGSALIHELREAINRYNKKHNV